MRKCLFEESYSNITEVRISAGKKVIVKAPKTNESKRKISIPDELFDVLKT